MHFLFDVMGTLIYDPFFREVPRVLQQPLMEFLKDKDRYAWIDFESGTIDEAGFINRFSARPDDAIRMREIIFTHYRWLEGMRSLLQELSEQGHTICTLSNYPSWYTVLRRKMNLDAVVQHHFVSYELGVRKPKPQIYHKVLNRLEIEPHEAVFVDDRLENVTAAQKVGIHAYHFKDVTSLVRAFHDKGWYISSPRLGDTNDRE